MDEPSLYDKITDEMFDRKKRRKAKKKMWWVNKILIKWLEKLEKK